MRADNDLVAMIKQFSSRILIRWAHGHPMLDDLKRKPTQTSAIGHLKGLAEIRGVEQAVRRAFFNR